MALARRYACAGATLYFTAALDLGSLRFHRCSRRFGSAGRRRANASGGRARDVPAIGSAAKRVRWRLGAGLLISALVAALPCKRLEGCKDLGAAGTGPAAFVASRSPARVV